MDMYEEGFYSEIMPNKPPDTWRTRNGYNINVTDMTDGHLVNAIKMMVRAWPHKGEKPANSKFDTLYREAKRRKFELAFMSTATIVEGREEYVEIFVRESVSKLSPDFEPKEISVVRED